MKRTLERPALRKVLSLLMVLSLVLMMTGMTALAAGAVSASKLSDGTYSVSVALWHSSKDQASMAASCLKEQADLTVKNGKKTMTVYTQPMTLAGITASMQTLAVKQPDGTLKDADVAERSSDGTPTAFRFEVPTDDEYIPVEVNPELEIMGNKPMDARIKVDYSAVKPKQASTDATSSATDATSSATTNDPMKSLLERFKLPDNTEADEQTVTAEEPAKETKTADPISSVLSRPVNKDDLADGTYTVNVKLWHAEKDQASMAESSLKPQAKIVVQNGKSVMYIYTRPMTFGNITASLQEMKVQNKDGSWSDAKVVSRSSDGNPTSFRFDLPSRDEYIPVQVNPHVEMMGNRFLDARIKVDWSTLKAASTETAGDPNGSDSSVPVTENSSSSDTVLNGTRASGVDTGTDRSGAMMFWYAIMIGAGTFALCFAVLRKGWV